jgi:hypothetical protein
MTKTINGLTVTTSAASGDYVPIWRASNADTRKITKANFIGAILTGGGTIATGGFTLTVGGTSAINGTISGAGTLATAGYTLTLAGTSSLAGTVSGGGTIATAGFTLTVPETGIAAMRNTVQAFIKSQVMRPDTTNAVALTLDMPAGTTSYASEFQYNGVTRFRFVAQAGATAISMTENDLGNNVAGPYIRINRNSNATNPTPGFLILHDKGGTDRYLWVDTTGDLRIHTSIPLNADTVGTVVGTQS